MKKFLLIGIMIYAVAVFANAALRSGTTYRLQTDILDQGGKNGTSENFVLRQGVAGQTGAIGFSTSASFESGQGYIYTINTKPSTPENLAQYRAGGISQIAPAGWTNTSTEVMKMNISDPDPGDILTPQIEVVFSEEAFSGSLSHEGFAYNYVGATLNASVSATSMAHAKAYRWQARVKDQENFYSDWIALGGSPSDFRVDLLPPTSVEGLYAVASPEPNPIYVRLTWEAATDAVSDIAGYNLYRSNTPEAGYTLVQSLISGLVTTDATVSLGTDYYYKVKGQDQAGSEGGSSREASAPYLILTREAEIFAPVSGGYTGNQKDPVPGATVQYNLYYYNKGFAPSTNIVITNRIPARTHFKIDSARGDAVTLISYSSNEGASFNYLPSGTYVDLNVTHIKWNCASASSGVSKKVEFSVVIR